MGILIGLGSQFWRKDEQENFTGGIRCIFSTKVQMHRTVRVPRQTIRKKKRGRLRREKL
jgi:hypothetical protein